MSRRWHVEPRGPLRGRVRVPGDKSISHRALMLNALACREARVRNLLASEDVRATARALVGLGVEIALESPRTVVVRGPRDGFREPETVIDCGNSGTTMRLIAGMLAACPVLTVLTGDPSLRRRPMGRIVQPLRKMGANIDGRNAGNLAPLVLRGGELQMVHHELPVASAQVKSAILLAGLRNGVALREPRLSRDHTERMLRRMGALLREAPDGWLVLLPTERLEPTDVDVPGDLSAAAFFLVGATILPGSEVELKGVGINPTRGGVLEVLKAMGANIEVHPIESDGAEPRADLLVRHASLKGTRIDGDLVVRALDELPMLAVAAAFAEGETVIADAAELRSKESDRIGRTVEALRSLGIDADERPDGMLIRGGRPKGPGLANAAMDHRIAMAFAIAGAATDGGVVIEGAESVGSSYPEFEQHLESLRA